MYTRSQNVIRKMTEEDEIFQRITENYEIDKNHNWFPKTIQTPQRGFLNKIHCEKNSADMG